jgi:STE24 endopeptidase
VSSLFALSLAGFALLGWLSTQVWFYTGLGVRPYISLDLAVPPVPNDALALLLFLLAVPVFTLFIAPCLQGFRASHEFEADAYAVAQTNGPTWPLRCSSCTKTTPPHSPPTRCM